MTPDATIDWRHWFDRWETQQAAYIIQREERFSVMLDVLDELLPPDFVAVDLACGPGAITKRVVERFPQARVIAIDLDPVLLTMAQSVIGEAGGRVTWVEANLLDPGWPALLGVSKVDAVLSTTAIHYLPPGAIVTLYQQIGELVREGGVFMNGDHMPFDTAASGLGRLVERFRAFRTAQREASGSDTWESWWQALRAEPATASLFVERDRRFSWRPAQVERNVGSTAATGDFTVKPTSYNLHRSALLLAGFREVESVWQHVDNRLLLAIR